MKKVNVFALCFFCIVLCFSCNKEKKEQERQIQINRQKELAVESYVESMPLKNRICQLFIMNILGNKTFVPVEKEYLPGAFLFFNYNLGEEPAQIMRFTDSVYEWYKKEEIISPFLALDQEGGFVNRLKVVSGPLPSALRVSSNLSVEEAQELYEMQAIQMKSLGFSLNLAPVVEVCTEKNELFLNGRSFGSYSQVLSYSNAFVNAFQKNGILCVAKHFPGNSNTDPHTGLPIINWNEEELLEQMNSFSSIIKTNICGILISHAKVSPVDSENPACFSSVWIKQKLQKELNFENLVFSDDIYMAALSKNGFPPEKAAVLSLEAGIDCIMVSEKRISSSVEQIYEKCLLDEEFSKKVSDSVKKIIFQKLRSGLCELEEISHEKGLPDFVLVLNPPQKSVEERLESFNKARDKNIDLYISHF